MKEESKQRLYLPYLVLTSTLTALSVVVLTTKDLGGMEYLFVVPIGLAFLVNRRDKCVLDWVMVTACSTGQVVGRPYLGSRLI